MRSFRLFFFVGEVAGINVLVFIFVFVGIDILIVKLIVGEIITLAVRKVIVFVLFLTLAQGCNHRKLVQNSVIGGVILDAYRAVLLYTCSGRELTDNNVLL